MDRSDKLDYTTEYEDPELDALIEQRCAEEQGMAGSVTAAGGEPHMPLLARALYGGIGGGGYGHLGRLFGGILWLFDITLLISDPLAYLLRIGMVTGVIYAIHFLLLIVDAWQP